MTPTGPRWEHERVLDVRWKSGPDDHGHPADPAALVVGRE
jgi:hypothetical protein